MDIPECLRTREWVLWTTDGSKDTSKIGGLTPGYNAEGDPR